MQPWYHNKYLLLPGLLCFGYVPVVILLVSISVHRSDENYKFPEVFDLFNDDPIIERYWNGLIFLQFFPHYMVCVLFPIYHIFTILLALLQHKKALNWKALIIAALHLFGSFLAIAAGSALVEVLDNFELFTDPNDTYDYKELKAVLTGIVVTIFVALIGYSVWPFLTRFITERMDSQQTLQMQNRFKHYYYTWPIAAVTVSSSVIGLFIYTGGAIAVTINNKEYYQEYKDTHTVMFTIVAEFLGVILLPILIVLIVLLMVLNYFRSKYATWIALIVAPMNWLTTMFLGLGTYVALAQICSIVFLRKLFKDSYWDNETRLYRSLIAQLVGGILLVISLLMFALTWSHVHWSGEVARANKRTSSRNEEDDYEMSDKKTIPA